MPLILLQKLAFCDIAGNIYLDSSRYQFENGAGPFLFVENGIIHVYYLQPRKSAGLDFDELCMVATIVKKYLLDTEFFGQRCDVEFVDVSAPERGDRTVRQFKLADMRLWSDRRLADRLTLLGEALTLASGSGKIEQRRRTYRRPEPEMPLFD